MNSNEWGKILGGALEKTRQEREAYNQRMGELEAHKEAMGNHGPWDAWDGRLCRWSGPQGIWLKDTETGQFLNSIGEYKAWRINIGAGWVVTQELAVEWSYLIGSGGKELDSRLWSIESDDEMLVWDMRTGCWLVDEDTSKDE